MNRQPNWIHSWDAFTWLVAIDTALKGDSKPLAQKLRSNEPISDEGRELLARFIEKDPTLSPQLSDRDYRLLAAAEEYRERKRKANETEDQFFARLAREFDVLPIRPVADESDPNEPIELEDDNPEDMQASKDRIDGTSVRNLVKGRGGDYRRLKHIMRIDLFERYPLPPLCR